MSDRSYGNITTQRVLNEKELNNPDSFEQLEPMKINLASFRDDHENIKKIESEGGWDSRRRSITAISCLSQPVLASSLSGGDSPAGTTINLPSGEGGGGSIDRKKSGKVGHGAERD